MAETIAETQENPQTQEIPQDPKVVKLLKAWDRTFGHSMLMAEFMDVFPGVWYVTFRDEVIFASGNYEDRLSGEWYLLGSAPLPSSGGTLIVHFMIPCPAESFPGVWYVTDKDGNVMSCSKNYGLLQEGRWHKLKTPRPDGETLHWMIKIAA